MLALVLVEEAQALPGGPLLPAAPHSPPAPASSHGDPCPPPALHQVPHHFTPRSLQLPFPLPKPLTPVLNQTPDFSSKSQGPSEPASPLTNWAA